MCREKITVVLLNLSIVPLMSSRAASAIFPHFSTNNGMYINFGAALLELHHEKAWINMQKAFDLEKLALREFRRAEGDDRPAFSCKDQFSKLMLHTSKHF